MTKVLLAITGLVVCYGSLLSVFVVIPVLVVWRMRWEKTPEAFQPLFRGLRTSKDPEPGMVHVEFEVFQFAIDGEGQGNNKLNLCLPPEDARVFLWRCVVFSFLRSVEGKLLIPFVILPNYWLQLRSIRQQVEMMNPEDRDCWPPLSTHLAKSEECFVPPKPLSWKAIIAWYIAGIMLLSSIVNLTIVCNLEEQPMPIATFVVLDVISTVSWFLLAKALTN